MRPTRYRRFSELLGLPVATTFHGKGVFADDHPNALGAVGFMSHDYVNFGFDEADVIVSVGYELQEFDPVRINPSGDTRIIHLSRVPAEVDLHYDVEVGVQGDIGRTLDALAAATTTRFHLGASGERIRRFLADDLARGAADDSFPLKPQRIVADTRAALGRSDIVLADTGAVKMWMARLYPTYEPNTCLVSNGLSTMAFALPGAIAAKLAVPGRRVLAAVGDGAFLMNSQEIETAVRERIPLTVLIWQDDAYGLIKWKMNLEIGHEVATDFSNPDFVAYAQSFGGGLPGSGCQRAPPDAHRRPGLLTPCRSSPARWTTRRIYASLMPSAISRDLSEHSGLLGMPSLEPRRITQRKTAFVAARPAVLHAVSEMPRGHRRPSGRPSDLRSTRHIRRGWAHRFSPVPTRSLQILVDLVARQLTEVGCDIPLVRPRTWRPNPRLDRAVPNVWLSFEMQMRN